MQRKPWKDVQWLAIVVGNGKLDHCVPPKKSLVIFKLQQLAMLNDGLCSSTNEEAFKGFPLFSWAQFQHPKTRMPSCTIVWVTTLWHSLSFQNIFVQNTPVRGHCGSPEPKGVWGMNMERTSPSCMLQHTVAGLKSQLTTRLSSYNVY